MSYFSPQSVGSKSPPGPGVVSRHWSEWLAVRSSCKQEWRPDTDVIQFRGASHDAQPSRDESLTMAIRSTEDPIRICQEQKNAHRPMHAKSGGARSIVGCFDWCPMKTNVLASHIREDVIRSSFSSFWLISRILPSSSSRSRTFLEYGRFSATEEGRRSGIRAPPFEIARREQQGRNWMVDHRLLPTVRSSDLMKQLMER